MKMKYMQMVAMALSATALTGCAGSHISVFGPPQYYVAPAPEPGPVYYYAPPAPGVIIFYGRPGIDFWVDRYGQRHYYRHH